MTKFACRLNVALYIVSVATLVAQTANQPQTPTQRSGPSNAATAAGSTSRPPSNQPSTTDKKENPTSNVILRIEQPQTAADNSSGWLKFLLNLVFPWPIIILLCLLYLFASISAPSRVRLLLGSFQSFKLFGQEFVMNREGGRSAETAIAYYRAQVRDELDLWSNRLKIPTKCERIFEKCVATLIPNYKDLNIRCTVHIPDLLFKDSLYQLVDYYPRQAEGGHGRAFSTRFGMIGKSWRIGESQHEGSVPTEPKRLILEWGMNNQEAHLAASGRQSFACILLTSSGTGLGIFYLDSSATHAFDEGVWEKLRDGITAAAQSEGLTKALEKINTKVIAASPQVSIYSSVHLGSK